VSDTTRHDELLSHSILRTADGLSLSRSSAGFEVIRSDATIVASIDDFEAAAFEIFSIPRKFSSGVSVLIDRRPDSPPDGALTAVCTLIDKKLIRLHEPGLIASSRRRGMFGCPTLSLDEALLGDSCDVVFLGMPYDLGVTGREGAKHGPSYLRRCSRSAFDYVQAAGVPKGWWDSSKDRRLLEGVRFVDVADVPCRASSRNGAAFDSLHDAVAALMAADRLPVVLGGDHSISFAAISAAMTRYPKLGIIQFDAHPDLGRSPSTSRWRRNLTHGNFMSWLEPKPQVQTVLQLGVRHLLPEASYTSDKIRSHPGRNWLGRIEEIAAALPPNMPYYVTFDVDCLDSSTISQTGTPVPGGLSYEDVRSAFQALARYVDIVGVDVVELTGPKLEGDTREGTLVSYLLFELLAAIFEKRSVAVPVGAHPT
jgi:agmatinase